MNKNERKENEQKVINHHPFVLAYMLIWIVIWIFALVFGFIVRNDALANFLISLFMGFILLRAVMIAQLSQKKSDLANHIDQQMSPSTFNNYYVDRVNNQKYKFAIYENAIFMSIIALVTFMTKNFFMSTVFALVTLLSFVDFKYSDDEYKYLLNKQEKISKNLADKTQKDQTTRKQDLGHKDEAHKQIFEATASIYPDLHVKDGKLDFKESPTSTKTTVSHKQDVGFKCYSFKVAGTTHHDLRKAVNYARKNDLLLDRYEGFTAKDIKEDMLDDVYETDLYGAVSEIVLVPEPVNKYDSDAIKVLITIGGVDFMIGYVPRDYTEHVHSTLKHYKKGDQEVKLSGHLTGGKVKYYDFDTDHVKTASRHYGFVVYVETKDK